MIRKALMVGCLGLTVAAWGWAQQGGGGAGAGTTGGGTTGGGNQGGGTTGGNQGGNQGGGRTQGGQSQDPFGQSQRQNQMEQMQMNRPIFLSGQVQLSNGSAPPESVVIERVCGGQTRPEGYTDSKGRFSFQVGADQSAALMVASYNGGGFGQNPAGGFGGGAMGMSMGGDGMGGMDLTGCELRASLPGFRSDNLMLGRRRPMDNPDVGTIVLHPLDGFIGSAISATTLSAPKKAKAAYDKGVREMRKQDPKFEKAAEQFEAAVAEHPEFAAAWTMLAEARMRLNDNEGAEQALEKSIDADPAYIRPYEPLVQMAVRKKDWPRVEGLADATLRMHPGQTQIRYFKAIAAYQQGRLDEAEATAREIASGSDAQAFPHAHQMMGVIYTEKGSYPKAAEAFRTYMQLAPTAPSVEQIRKQLNEWEALGVIKPVAPASAASN